MSTPHSEQLAALTAAGFPLDAITEEQRAVFATLSAEEVALLIDLRARLDELEPEVQAHTVAGAGVF
jgi:hypothetical protein